MSKANGYDTGGVFKNAALLVLPLWALMFVAVPVLTLLIAALAEALGFSIAIEFGAASVGGISLSAALITAIVAAAWAAETERRLKRIQVEDLLTLTSFIDQYLTAEGAEKFWGEFTKFKEENPDFAERYIFALSLAQSLKQ